MGCGSSSSGGSAVAAGEQQPAEQRQPVEQHASGTAAAHPTRPPPAAQPAESVGLDETVSSFSAAEITTLKKRFQSMAKLEKDDGLLDKREFLTILKFEDSLFTDRIFNLFDVDHSGAITVDEFIRALSILSPKGDTLEKIRLSFRMWDLNNDGVIAKSELIQLMKSSLDASSLLVSEEQMNKLIDSTFSLADCDHNGSITFAEYEKLVQQFPMMIQCMTLDISADLLESKDAKGSARD
eukprot:TRINITY_DN1822_c0_g1_i1.p1 TRINITY_DN1822_c0_g1~~TRINITY_DN1822_c0_g1_i1.p1  ORF type:complete len:239 (-),score=47.01 TRINITY_DN1822_c0_g1_i1:60-776(-)